MLARRARSTQKSGSAGTVAQAPRPVVTPPARRRRLAAQRGRSTVTQHFLTTPPRQRPDRPLPREAAGANRRRAKPIVAHSAMKVAPRRGPVRLAAGGSEGSDRSRPGRSAALKFPTGSTFAEHPV
ncbi:hypothetical protein BgiBS90_038144 [Biomphalaria glabrata]|nr:hypothetical protein BgiBS90_038144 [Biomphalaria glabrata]